MMRCEDVSQGLPIFMDEALQPEERTRVEAHLASCDRCRADLEGILQVTAVLRDAATLDLVLPDASRRKIAREAAQGVQKRRRSFLFPEWVYSIRPGALATGAAIVVALLVLPAIVRQRPEQAPGDPVSTIRVTADGQAVHLAWSDGTRSSYTVYKSHDPRTFGRAEAHVIKGNSWVDRDADGAPIVFYRIE